MRFLLVAWLAASLASRLGAQILEQYDSRIAVGAHVRLRVPDDSAGSRLVDGKVRSMDRGIIEVIEGSGRITPTSLRDLNALEVRDRDQGLTVAFAGAGFIAGSALYLTWCSQNERECGRQDRDEDLDGRADAPPIFAVMTFGTAIVSGLVGYVLTPVRWQEVPMRVAVGATPKGAALAFRLPIGRRRLLFPTAVRNCHQDNRPSCDSR